MQHKRRPKRQRKYVKTTQRNVFIATYLLQRIYCNATYLFIATYLSKWKITLYLLNWKLTYAPTSQLSMCPPIMTISSGFSEPVYSAEQRGDIGNSSAQGDGRSPEIPFLCRLAFSSRHCLLGSLFSVLSSDSVLWLCLLNSNLIGSV